MKKHMNVEFCSLTLDDSLHDEDKDVNDNCFVDDDVDKDNINTNKAKNIGTDACKLPIPKQLSLVASVVFLFSSFCYYYRFKQASLSQYHGAPFKQIQTGIPEPISWCPNLQGYLSKYPHLTRIFVGSPAKSGGTTVKKFFKTRSKWKDSFCAWSVTGSMIGNTKFNTLPSLQHLISLQCELLHDSNGRQTLFLISVREKISWIRSATKHIVEKQPRGIFNNMTSFDWVSDRPFELARSPADVVRKYQLIDNNMLGAHVLIFDYTHLDSIIECLPGRVHAVRTNSPSASLLVSKGNNLAPMRMNVAHKNSSIFYPDPQNLEKLYDKDGVGMKRWKSIGKYIEAVSGPVPQCHLASWHGNVLTCVV